MPVVNVCTSKNDTAPKSASVSISTKAVPATMAGRASGRPTRQNMAAGPHPSVRLTSSTHTDCDTKLARAAMYTYGYSAAARTKAAPPAERISGNQYSRQSSPVQSRSQVCTGPVNCSRSV